MENKASVSSGKRPSAFTVICVCSTVALVYGGAMIQLSVVSPMHREALVEEHIPELSSSSENQNAGTNMMKHLGPAFFPIDQNGTIDFPPHIDSVVIDVGARNSDYLDALEDLSASLKQQGKALPPKKRKTKEFDKYLPTTAVIVVDPLPDSIIPLAQRVSKYAMTNSKNNSKQWLDPRYMHQAFYLRTAVGESEGIADFYVANVAVCSSLLPTAKNNTFGCAKSRRSIKTNVIRLESLIDLIPQRIKSINLKVDAEGADLMVIRSAGSKIARFDTVLMECFNSDRPNVQWRQGECRSTEAAAYMDQQNFDLNSSRIHKQENLRNMFFTNRNVSGGKVVLPPMLNSSKLEYPEFYKPFY